MLEGTLESFLARPFEPGLQVLVERYDGRLHLECPWTSDVRAARLAIARLFKRSFLQMQPSPGDFGKSSVERLSEAVPYDSDGLSHFAKRSLAAVYQALLLFPEAQGGRRTLVWVTDGTPLLLPASIQDAAVSADAAGRRAPPGAPSWVVAQRGPGDLRPQVTIREETFTGWSEQLQQVTAKAIQREIAIMPVKSDAGDAGLFLGDASVGAEGMTRSAATPSTFQIRADVVHGMTGVGTVTGAEATLVGGYLDRDLRQAVARRGDGYLVTFRDPAPKDPRLHEIVLTVTRPGARLRYRRAYQNLDPLTQLSDRVQAGLQIPLADNPLKATASATILERRKDQLTVGITIRFPPLPEAGGFDTRSRKLQVVAAAVNSAGDTSLPFGEEGTTRTVLEGERTMLQHSFVVRVRPGRHTWSVGVRDVETGIVSYLRFSTAL